MWLKGYKSSFRNLRHKCDLLRMVVNHGVPSTVIEIRILKHSTWMYELVLNHDLEDL